MTVIHPDTQHDKGQTMRCETFGASFFLQTAAAATTRARVNEGKGKTGK